jgi:putative DNA modification/repair radical SAM protein
MDTQRKLEILADAAKYDASCASSGAKRSNESGGLGNNTGVGICHSYTPDGRCISLLKILLTNYCIYDCQYCINRLSSDVPRARFEPSEVVDLTIEFYRRNYIEGLFLSSGIIRDADYTMDQLARVAESLRDEHDFNGYIHLKAVPGASGDVIERAGRWADRLSANIELPTQDDLDELAPAKTIDDVEDTMGEIRERHDEYREESKKHRSAPRFAPAGQSTQMIVGATPAADHQILQTASHLYDGYGLRRVYYSAFSPIPDAAAALPVDPPPLVREHRLYQADWLLRNYGYDADELTSKEQPNLPLDIDPKLAWALRHRDWFPVDLNEASREEILRVPGIGTTNVARILRTRRHHRITLEDLRRMRARVDKAAPFIVVAGSNPAARRLDDLDLRYQLADGSTQQSLFSAADGLTRTAA